MQLEFDSSSKKKMENKSKLKQNQKNFSCAKLAQHKSYLFIDILCRLHKWLWPNEVLVYGRNSICPKSLCIHFMHSINKFKRTIAIFELSSFLSSSSIIIIRFCGKFSDWDSTNVQLLISLEQCQKETSLVAWTHQTK